MRALIITARSRDVDPKEVFSYELSSVLKGWTGAVVRASEFGPRGPLFEPRPGAFSVALSKSHLPLA